MSEGRNEDLRDYLPGPKLVRELADTHAADERIAAALEDPGLKVAREEAATGATDAATRRAEAARAAKKPRSEANRTSKSQEPAPVSIPQRPKERPRSKRWTPAVLSALGALAVLLPAGLAIVLFSRPADRETPTGDVPAGAAQLPPSAAGRADAMGRPAVTTGAAAGATSTPSIEASVPTGIPSTTGAAALTGAAPTSPSVPPTVAPVKPRGPGSPRSSGAPSATVPAPTSTPSTPATAPPEPTGSGPRYTDPDF